MSEYISIRSHLSRRSLSKVSERLHTEAQILGWADAYAQSVEDPAERCHVEAMIEHWQETGDISPLRMSAQTLPMRQVARILRGGARYDGQGGIETLP